MKKMIALLLIVTPMYINAESMTWEAEVVRSEPTTLFRQLHEPDASCFESRPDDLRRLLQWDVGCELPTTVEVPAFLITYEVDGHHFTTMRDEPPGNTIRVRMNLTVSSDEPMLAGRSTRK